MSSLPPSATIPVASDDVVTQGEDTTVTLTPIEEGAQHSVLAVTPNARKRRQTRAGVPNYSNDELDHLLDIVSEVLPLGSNHWALVANKFAKWAEDQDNTLRDQDSIKNKFDKLANCKKKTGDPSCPPHVRRAKKISRDIQNKCTAKELGSDDGTSEEDNDGAVGRDGYDVLEGTAMEHNERHKKKLRMGSNGLHTSSKSSKSDNVLLDSVGEMAENVGQLSQAVVGIVNVSSTLTEEDIKKVVKEEIARNLQPTNKLLHQMSEMIKRMGSKETNVHADMDESIKE